MSCFICGLMFELTFFAGHYLGTKLEILVQIIGFFLWLKVSQLWPKEHVFPNAYRKFHLLHHTTKADTAISGYYMTGYYSCLNNWKKRKLVVDYFGEGPIPMLMQLIPVAYFNLSAVAVIHGVSLKFMVRPSFEVDFWWTYIGYI